MTTRTLAQPVRRENTTVEGGGGGGGGGVWRDTLSNSEDDAIRILALNQLSVADGEACYGGVSEDGSRPLGRAGATTAVLFCDAFDGESSSPNAALEPGLWQWQRNQTAYDQVCKTEMRCRVRIASLNY